MTGAPVRRYMFQFLQNIPGTGTCFKENYFSLQLFLIFSFKIDSITLDPDPDKHHNLTNIII